MLNGQCSMLNYQRLERHSFEVKLIAWSRRNLILRIGWWIMPAE